MDEPTMTLGLPSVTGQVGRGQTVDGLAFFALLNEFSATIPGEFSSDDIMRLLVEGVTNVLAVDGAGVMAPGAPDGTLRVAAATPGSAQELEKVQETAQEGPARVVQGSLDAVSVPDLTTVGAWPRFQHEAGERGVRSVTSVPLQVGQRIWGVLDLYRKEATPLSDVQLLAATTLANLATSYLLVNEAREVAHEAQRELAHRAMQDPLTGLPVRWVLFEQLSHALAQLERHPGIVAILFVDVDGLKQVNDSLGHAAGDELLTTCARRIGAALRPSDVLARIGGDEFVVLLEQLTARDAPAVVAQRILDELAAPSELSGGTAHPSVSIGIAVTSEPGVTADVLVSRADTAMYAAKRAGRGGYALFEMDDAANRTPDGDGGATGPARR